MPNNELQRPAGQQLHDVAVMLTGMVERLADTVSGPLRGDAEAVLSSARLIIEAHESPMPDLVELARELRNMMAMTDARIEVRAGEIADRAILADRAAADVRYAELQRDRQRDKNRSDDLIAELRRQMHAMELGRARYGNALVDTADQIVTVRAGSESMGGWVARTELDRLLTFVRGKGPGRRMPEPERPA